MAVHLGLATCFTVLACLLQPTVSEHKKKIIVKVPHVIKHIHHDVYKPVHVHKVHAKKVEHHHHEKHEERLPKWKPKREKGGKHNAHGSFSHLQPVLLHQESQENIEHPAPHRHGIEYGVGQEYGRGQEYSNGQEYRKGQEYHNEQEYRRGQEYSNGQETGRGQEYRNGHDYSQEADWSLENDSGERGTRPIGDGSRLNRPKWEPIDLGGWYGRDKEPNDNDDEWLISSEDLRELREDYGFLGGKSGSVNGQKRKKDKPLKLPTEPTLVEMEKDGWKPLMDFSGWKDVGELHKKDHRGYNADQFNYSGEDELEGSSEEEVSGDRGFPENHQNKRKKPRKNLKKSAKWSKQIEVQEHTNEEDTKMYHRPTQPHNYQPQIRNLSPVQQISHVHSQNGPEQIHPESQPRQTAWQTQQVPQSKWPEPLPTPHAQQWPYPHSAWQPHATTTPPPLPPPPPPPSSTHPSQAQPSSVVWSGHHLQTPQHTMWHVQQHNMQTPVQSPVNYNPPSTFPVHSPPLLPFRQPQPQSQQASVPTHRVAAPVWPPTQKTPGVMQQWEQTVHMGDGAGPGSAYKVEVINYGGQ